MNARLRGYRPAPLVRASLWLHGAALAVAAADPALWRFLLGVVLADHLAMGAAGLMPRGTALGPNLTNLPEPCARRGEVALTFDDGPEPGVTPRVLALLDRAGARASFFVIGARARAHPALVREILAAGHSVENHTETHPALFAAYGPRAMGREIARAQESIIAAGASPGLFRAPVGLRSPFLDFLLARAGLSYAGWTRRGRDGIDADPARVLSRLTRGLASGDILMLHDGRSAADPAGRPVVLEVLPRLLDCLAARGLHALSLPMALAAAEQAAAHHAREQAQVHPGEEQIVAPVAEV